MSAIPRPFVMLGLGGAATNGWVVPSTATNGILVYNTVDQTTNYERFQIAWSGNVAYLRTVAAGTGTLRPIIVGAGTTTQLTLDSNGTGSFTGTATTTASSSRFRFLGVGSNALSGTNAALTIEPTYNQASGTAANTDLLINRTQTAVGSGAQNLLDLQVNGASHLRVTNNNALVLGTSGGSFNIQDFAQTTRFGATTTTNNYTATATSGANTAHSFGCSTLTGAAGINQVGAAFKFTINQTSTAGFTDLLVNRTQTAAGSGTQRLLDLQVGGVTKFNVDNTGRVTGRVKTRVTSIVSNATPTINTDNCDAVSITALATAITSMTTNLTGTPDDFDQLQFRIKDDGSARAITWGASFVSGIGTLPTTTVAGKVLTVALEWDSVKAQWVCVAANSEP